MPWSTSTHPGSTRQSRALRADVLRYWPTCYLRSPGCTLVSTRDDHVVPLSQGGTDHWDNHRGACENCHDLKTQCEAQAGKPTRRRPPERHPGLLHPGE
jgi:5-methylcytosine-specific restriction endonuclease McrA